MDIGVIGLVMMLLVLAAIMSNRVSPVVAMIVIPVLACLVAGQAGSITTYVTNGVKGVATTACMFGFSVLFFGVLMDAGTFEPIVNRILKVVGSDPLKIVVGTAILAMIIHLDGSGVVTFGITIPAMMPLYDKLGMRRMTLALVTALSAGTMNLLPWGGPTMRAIVALNSSVAEIFTPMIPPMIAGLATVLVIAFILGKKERAFINWAPGETMTIASDRQLTAAQEALLRPNRFWINIVLIIVTVAVMLTAVIPTFLAFMLASAAALIVNYPDVKDQASRINAHAVSAMMMVSIIFSSGILSGILTGSGMSDGVTRILLSIIPHSVGNYIPAIVGLFSAPIQQLIPTDAYYYGALPLLANVISEFGIDPTVIARVSLLGHSTTGFPFTPTAGASVFLVGLTGLKWGEWQRKGIPLAMLVTAVMLLVSFITGSAVV